MKKTVLSATLKIRGGARKTFMEEVQEKEPWCNGREQAAWALLKTNTSSHGV